MLNRRSLLKGLGGLAGALGLARVPEIAKASAATESPISPSLKNRIGGYDFSVAAAWKFDALIAVAIYKLAVARRRVEFVGFTIVLKNSRSASQNADCVAGIARTYNCRGVAHCQMQLKEFGVELANRGIVTPFYEQNEANRYQMREMENLVWSDLGDGPGHTCNYVSFQAMCAARVWAEGTMRDERGESYTNAIHSSGWTRVITPDFTPDGGFWKC